MREFTITYKIRTTLNNNLTDGAIEHYFHNIMIEMCNRYNYISNLYDTKCYHPDFFHIIKNNKASINQHINLLEEDNEL